jgi:hypothetical protein
MRELKSITSPGLTGAPGSTSSEPVGSTATEGRRRTVAGRQDQLGRHHVLAHRADVLPGRDGRHQLDLVVPDRFQVLDHHHRVGARRQRVAGVHPGRARAEPEADRRGLGGAGRVLGAHGRAVHRGRVVVRRGQARPDRLGGDAAERVGHGDGLARNGVQQAGRLEGAPPPAPGLLERHVVEIDLSLHGRVMGASP